MEEAKNFDAESQVDVCLQIQHLLVMHMLNKIKEDFYKKRLETKNRNDSRKSSIPVLIQGNNKQHSTSITNVDVEKINSPTEGITLYYIYIYNVLLNISGEK